jgi:hypothetical protein
MVALQMSKLLDLEKVGWADLVSGIALIFVGIALVVRYNAVRKTRLVGLVVLGLGCGIVGTWVMASLLCLLGGC